MANYNRNGWLDAAMAQVRSKPEHTAIRAELQGHLEDKEQYFLEKGMEPREAGKAAPDPGALSADQCDGPSGLYSL